MGRRRNTSTPGQGSLFDLPPRQAPERIERVNRRSSSGASLSGS